MENLVGSGSVLWVESNDIVKDRVGTFLEYNEFEHVDCSSANEALAILRQGPEHYDLTLMGTLALPHYYAGLALARKVQEMDPLLPRVMVLVNEEYKMTEIHDEVVNGVLTDYLWYRNDRFNDQQAAANTLKELAAQRRAGLNVLRHSPPEGRWTSFRKLWKVE